MIRELLVAMAFSGVVLGASFVPMQVSVEAEPHALLGSAGGAQYLTMSGSTAEPVYNEAELYTRNGIDARFAGLLSHIRWLMSQDDGQDSTRTTTRDDNGWVRKQFESLTDDVSDEFRDLGNEFHTGELTVSGDTELAGSLTVAGTSTLHEATLSNAVIDGATYITPIITPANTTNFLYSSGGDLYFSGHLIGGGSVGAWATNSTDVWRTGGNVGIGTNTINGGADLQIVDASAHIWIQDRDSVLDAGGLAASIKFKDAVGVSVGQVGYESGSTQDFKIFNNAASNMIFKNAGIEAMRITSNGSIGIGTTSPAYKLHIENSSASVGAMLHSGNGYATINLDRSTTAHGSDLRFLTAGTENW